MSIKRVMNKKSARVMCRHFVPTKEPSKTALQKSPLYLPQEYFRTISSAKEPVFMMLSDNQTTTRNGNDLYTVLFRERALYLFRKRALVKRALLKEPYFHDME